MKTCKVFVPCGALGTGIEPKSFQQGVDLNPDIISLDAGSTDSGPYYLGTANPKYARDSVKSDLKQILVAAQERDIPVTIGSCGTCGTDNMVDMVAELCREIFAEEGFTRSIAKIYTEQSPAQMAEQFRNGKIRALEGAPAITEETFARCGHIVALAGVEPFQKALTEGAQVVLCGRATDTAVIAAYPILQGFDPALAWHAAKIAECGALCTENPTDGGVFLTFDEEGVIVQAASRENRCSVYSVSAHLLYENADPIRLTEPGCITDTSESRYIQLPDGTVRVQGTKHIPMPYTMKLEGAGRVGYQTISLVGIRDRAITRAPMPWINHISAYVTNKLNKLGLDPATYSFELRPYGWNAVYGGTVPEGYVANELGILFVATGDTQEIATKVAKVFNPYLLHFPTKLDAPLPSYGFAFSPAETERGAVFEFMLHHVIELEDPLSQVRIVMEP